MQRFPNKNYMGGVVLLFNISFALLLFLLLLFKREEKKNRKNAKLMAVRSLWIVILCLILNESEQIILCIFVIGFVFSLKIGFLPLFFCFILAFNFLKETIWFRSRRFSCLRFWYYTKKFTSNWQIYKFCHFYFLYYFFVLMPRLH